MLKQLGAAPLHPEDAATKGYVDSAIAQGGAVVYIQEYADLDTMIEPGHFQVMYASEANTLKNVPIPSIPGPDSPNPGAVRSTPIGALHVRNVGGRVYQEYMALSSSASHGRPVVYVRFRAGDGYWQPWVWPNGSGVHQVNSGLRQRLLAKELGASENLPVTVRRTDYYPAITVTTTNGDTWQYENSGFAPSPSWDALPLRDAWVNYGMSYRTAQIMRTTAGIVMLRGLVKGGTYNTYIGTLPVGHRPPFRMIFSQACGYNIDSACRVDIYPNGDIYLAAVGQPGATGALSFLSLSGIAFPCNEVAPPAAWTNLAMVNGFVDFAVANSGAGWGRCSYWEDSLGRVWLTGIAARSSAPSESMTYTRLPAKYAIDRSIHVQGYNGAGFASQDYGNGGGIDLRYKTGGPTDVSYISLPTAPILPTAVFPNSMWRIPGLQGNWVTYDASQFPSPSSFYAADGIVHTRGLVKGGSPGPLANLDPGYRSEPSLDEIFAVNANNNFARVDAGANRLAAVSGSNVWRSLDGVFYLREA